MQCLLKTITNNEMSLLSYFVRMTGNKGARSNHFVYLFGGVSVKKGKSELMNYEGIEGIFSSKKIFYQTKKISSNF